MKNSLVHRLFLGCLVSVFVLSFAFTALAQKKRGGDKVIRLEDITIVGRVQKPNAFFINTRQALVYDVLEIDESFIAEIGRSVKDGPF